MESEPETQPMAVCESCWMSDHTRWEPESMDEFGGVILKLLGVDVPQKVNTGSVEICCMCGAVTVCGIYEFKDPEKVYFTGDSGQTPQFELELSDYYFDEED